MHVKRLNNSSEQVTFNELRKGLSEGDFLVFPKIPLRDVIDKSSLSVLRPGDDKHFNTSHFDFVVCDSSCLPKFAVEFDGPAHNEYEKMRLKDIKKNRICALAEFPLLRISDAELEQYDAISLLNFIAHRFTKWNDEALQKQISEEMGNSSSTDWDLSFQFDLKFPFPLIAKLKKELEDKFRITSFFSLGSFKGGLCYDVQLSQFSYDGGYCNCTYEFGVYRSNQKIEPKDWYINLTPPNHKFEIQISGKVSFGIRSSLVIEKDYGYSISPFEYLSKNDFMPVYYPRIPGAIISSISETFCEYLAYKRIHEWANTNVIV